VSLKTAGNHLNMDMKIVLVANAGPGTLDCLNSNVREAIAPAASVAQAVAEIADAVTVFHE